jgi:two-component SAPR family response regulator
MPWLRGKRILVVEDEALISVMVSDMLAELGIQVVGPAGTISAAIRLAEEMEIDAAILDVNVRGERIDPVAEILFRREVPLLFATGYGEVKLASGRSAPVIDKPYTQDKLVRGLSMALGGPPQPRRMAN